VPVELSVVLPAHDEEDVIASVVDELARVLAAAGVAFEILVVDDASTDRTGAILDELAAARPEVRVLHLPENCGHGPALRTGWEAAQAPWIGHLDGDGEVPASELGTLWDRRDGFDLVLGVRTSRTGGIGRRAVTSMLRVVARFTARQPLADANVPCKLVRREWLGRLFEFAPADAFAPSVLLAVVVARGGGQIVEIPVAVRHRPGRRSWLVPSRLVAGCARSLRDALALSRRL